MVRSKKIRIARSLIRKANFRFSSNILKRLGEELNPSASQGLIELVKNSYDADAKECVVVLDDVNNPGGNIHVHDDGIGMGRDEIINGWLVLGKSEKLKRGLTKLGRKPVGDKGLGRLAALRLGKSTTLISTPIRTKQLEYILEIDWDKYENSDLVEDVILNIDRVKYDKPQQCGTSIYINNLRNHINRNEVKKLARAMILLADPFGDNPIGFKPILKSSEFTDLEELVEQRYFTDAEFHLIANVNDEGISKAKVLDWKGNTIFKTTHQDLRSKSSKKPYRCPEATFDMWVYILDEVTFSTRNSTLSEVKGWLKEFGGIHLYYNDIRTSPYGDYADDWLGLNLMRAKSPESRPSTNTSVGRIRIKDYDELLNQKTDRSGFIENEAFENLKMFAVDALNWMAKKRLEEAEVRRRKARAEAPQKSKETKNGLLDEIELVKGRGRKKLLTSFQKYDTTRRREINNLKKEVQLYRTLSTVGITSAVFAHESANNPLKVISQSIKTIRTRIKKYIDENYEKYFKKPVERIIHSTSSIRVLSNVTLSLLEHDKRRASRVNINQIISKVKVLYNPFLLDRDASVTLELDPAKPYLRGSISAIETIISNLLNNSLYAFERVPPKERRIIIRTTVYDNIAELRILDNGPGIEGIRKSEIWLPGFTTTPNGTGLGLTIVKDVVTDLGGEVEAIEHGELGGAELIINLPILG